jgi:hypothetical protein
MKVSPYDPAGMELLNESDPRLKEAVRLYVDPLSSTFGNKTASCKLAGYADSRPLDSPVAQAQIEKIQENRTDFHSRVYEFITSFGLDAAREMVDQLNRGRELDFILPEEEDFEMEVVATEKGPVKITSGRDMKAINDHNKNVIALMRARRETAERILAYKIGPHTKPMEQEGATRRGPLDGLLDTSKYSKEELSYILQVLEGARRQKVGAGEGVEVIEADFEVVVEEEEEAGPTPGEGWPDLPF